MGGYPREGGAMGALGSRERHCLAGRPLVSDGTGAWCQCVVATSRGAIRETYGAIRETKETKRKETATPLRLSPISPTFLG